MVMKMQNFGRLLAAKRFCEQDAESGTHTSRRGFTLVEVIIVVVILAISAMIAVPMMSSAGSVQIRSAADALAADLEYAKSMAISHQQNYGIIFYPDNDKYKVVDQSNNEIPHPVKRGFPYTIDFRSDSRLNKVDMVSADFGDTTHQIKFNYLGSPFNGSDADLNSAGTIVLQGGGSTITITVEPVTGFISISH